MEANDADNKHTFILQNPPRQHQSSSAEQPILSLRIPASTLLQVGASSEFILDPSDESGGGSVLRTSQDVNEQDEALTIRTDPISTRIYKQKSNNKLVHVGNTSKCTTIQTVKEVELLGKRARETLEQEQRKRPEIVRLQQDPGNDDHKRSGLAFAEAIRKQRPRPAMKRGHFEKFSDSFPQASTGTVDTWKPSIAHVSTTSAPGERSSVVRLHGLPKSVKPESIRNFFAGLDVERIFVLVSNKKCIREWDELEQDSCPIIVARYDATFRVYVKFVSSPAADMGLARSEEYLYVNNEHDEKIGVHIAMTKVPKIVAGYLQHNLAIDSVVRCALDETLSDATAHIGPKVASFLWTMATRDLNLSSSMPVDNDETKFPWHDNPAQWNPVVSFSDYQKLVQHYNSLVDEHKDMEQSRVSFDMKEWDPRYYADAVMRIKRAASDRLLAEIESVKQMLYRARVNRRRLKSQ